MCDTRTPALRWICVVPDEAHKLALTARYGKGYFTKPVKKFLEIYNPKQNPWKAARASRSSWPPLARYRRPEKLRLKMDVLLRPFVKLASMLVCRHWRFFAEVANTLPGRHQVTYGDSTLTLPVVIANGGLSCDFVFVDGGHTHAIAKADLLAFKKLSTPGTTIAVDNCNMWNAHHGNGGVPEVSTAYLDLVKEGLIYHHKQISVNDCFGKGSDLCREVCVGVYS